MQTYPAYRHQTQHQRRYILAPARHPPPPLPPTSRASTQGEPARNHRGNHGAGRVKPCPCGAVAAGAAKNQWSYTSPLEVPILCVCIQLTNYLFTVYFNLNENQLKLNSSTLRARKVNEAILARPRGPRK